MWHTPTVGLFRRRRQVAFALRGAGVSARDGDPRLAAVLACAYGVLGIAAGALAIRFSETAGVRGVAAWPRLLAHPRPWLDLDPVVAASLSMAAGVALAFLVVTTTRIAVSRFRWARDLSIELRPFARRLSPREIGLVAVMSGVGEELFFRAFLVPASGIFVASVLFGLVHQVPGPSRWVWATWATVVGALLAGLYAATGSLVGPIVAHVLVNATNLSFLKSYDGSALHPLRADAER